MQWGNILLAEFIFTTIIVIVYGYVKLPAFLRRRRLAKGFPWGYYTDAVPQEDPGFFNIEGRDFRYDLNTPFAGTEGFGLFGEFGEFSGFGEMGEFGGNFGGGGE